MKRLLVILIIGLACLPLGMVLVIGCLSADQGKADTQTEKPETQKPVDERITKLIKQLGNDDWEKRDAATTELFHIGPLALASLEKATKHSTDPEIRLRAHNLIKNINTKLAILFKTFKHLSEDLINRLWQHDRNLWLELILRLGKLPPENEPTPEQGREVISLCLKELDWARLPLRTKLEIMWVFQRYCDVPTLVKRLEDNNAEVRRTAVWALHNSGAKGTVPEILKRLEDDNWKVRVAAVAVLSQLGERVHVPEVIKRLEDNNWKVRDAAIETLRHLGAKEAVPEIIKRLEDDHDWVRCGAAYALGKLGAKEAVPEIIKRLEDNDAGVRRVAIEALGRLGAKKAVPEIIKRLEDDHQIVRKEAVEALGKLGAKEAAPEIIKRLEDKDKDVRKAAQEVLEGWGIKPPEDEEE